MSAHYNLSCSHFMFSLHSDLTVPLWLQVCCTMSGQSYPTKEYPTGLFIGLWPHCFHKIMYLYCICLVFTTCYDATITKHKRNTNVQELRTLLNSLLLTLGLVAKGQTASGASKQAITSKCYQTEETVCSPCHAEFIYSLQEIYIATLSHRVCSIVYV